MQQFVTRFGCLPGVSSRPRTILIPGVLAYSNLPPVFTTNGRNGTIIATKRALHKLTRDSAKTELLLRFSIRLLAEGLVFERENMMNSWQEHDDSCWNLKFALAIGHQPPSEDMIAAKTPFHPRCLEVGSHNLLPWRLCQDKTVSCFMRRDEFVSFV